VVWQKSGDFTKSKFVSFFRRNENMLSITYSKEKGTVTVRGKPIGKIDAKRLLKMGLNMKGFLQIKTDARVVEHNAAKVTDKSITKIYGWGITSVNDPSPVLVISRR